MLSELLTTDIYRFIMLFARMGGMVMMLPGLSATFVWPRVRLLFALALTFLLLPLVGPSLPAQPSGSPMALVLMLSGEIIMGVFLATVVQALMSALDVAGNFIGYQVGLTNAFTFDPVSQQQNALITGFLNTVGMLLIFITDLHHLMIRGLVASYELYRPGQELPMGDLTDVLSRTVSQSFAVGLQLASPLVVFGLLFSGAMALLSRLAPQMQVFFVALPMQILFGLSLLMLALPAILLVFLRYMQGGLMPFGGG